METLQDLFIKTDDTQTLRKLLLASLKEFSQDDDSYSHLLDSIFSDVKRASSEKLEIFPVCHHSPASASFMVKRLLQKQPKVIFMEMCEDLRPLLEDLRQCTFPVALQAYALETKGFPSSWTPLSIVAPITEFSAEYQAITYALEMGVDIVFVDRSCDHVFQWLPQKEESLENETAKQRVTDEDGNEEGPDEKEQDIHGSSLGIQIGNNYPNFAEFEEFLLKNANVKHYSEWWEKYIEEALVGEDYQTYYKLMYFIGSLYRRLRQTNKHNFESDCKREAYMWQRMKEYTRNNDISPEDCLYICGAFHSISDVKEFGIESAHEFEISEPSETNWLYGIIPSSYFAIEYQFGLPSGTISLAEANWKKTLAKEKQKPFKLAKKKKAIKLPKSIAATDSEDNLVELIDFLGKAPEEHKTDIEQLTNWCTSVVSLARKNGYMASTADSIAIYQTSILLANLRGRQHPSPYDFKEAAITCLEKDSTPKKRNIAQVCSIMLGGDRSGTVGYLSMPPLAQDVFDRLKPLNKKLDSKTIQRVLIDFRQNPELRPCSDLLWKLKFLTGNTIARPIMGERSLGFEPIQESWDLAIGKYQRVIIELGYEGINIEYVIEKRLKQAVYSSTASAAKGLNAVEKCILFLDNPRLVEELGTRSVELISKEDSITEAPEIFKKIRKLLHYYRSQGQQLPHWLNEFITEGYSHYCTMLPKSFVDEDISAEQVCAMTGFIFTLESLALSLGCNREQFIIAIKQSEPEHPVKQSLLWTAEIILSMKKTEELRPFFDDLLNNPMRLASYPDYLKGFIMALDFTTITISFSIELLSKAFERLPDAILLPWLPKLITSLQHENPELMARIVKEASMIFPASLNELKKWQPSWNKTTETSPKAKPSVKVSLNEDESKVNKLILQHSDTMTEMAKMLDFRTEVHTVEEDEQSIPSELSKEAKQVNKLLKSYPDTMNVLSIL